MMILIYLHLITGRRFPSSFFSQGNEIIHPANKTLFVSHSNFFWICATPQCRNSIIPSVKQCKFVDQSVRALPIRIITVGKKRSPGMQLLVDGYIDKLGNYCAVGDVLIRSNPKNTRDVRAQVDDEDMAVMNHIRSDDWVVMLDEHGLDIGSEQFAELVGDAGSKGASRLLFCIGGPYGHGRQIRERANISVKSYLQWS